MHYVLTYQIYPCKRDADGKLGPSKKLETSMDAKTDTELRDKVKSEYQLIEKVCKLLESNVGHPEVRVIGVI